jgi:hypothetical protein
MTFPSLRYLNYRETHLNEDILVQKEMCIFIGKLQKNKWESTKEYIKYLSSVYISQNILLWFSILLVM